MNADRNDSTLGHFLALMLVSAGMLAFEVSLTRFFAVQQFHHFAFMVVSLAVLGISASGLAISLSRRQPRLATLAVAYSLAAAASYLLINRLAFDSYAIAWDRRQVWILALYFLAASVPFLLAGWAAGSSLAAAGERAHRPYAAVFVGSAFGAPAALLAHYAAGTLGAFGLSVSLGFVAAAVATRNSAVRAGSALAVVAVALTILMRPVPLLPSLSPYKPLETARRAPQAELKFTRWDGSTRLDVVEGGAVHAYPGLSLRPGPDLPEQVGLFVDGDGPLPVTRLDPDGELALAISERMPSHVAYDLRPQARVLILTPGAGLEAQLALAAGASTVAIPDEPPLVLDILAGPLQQASGQLLDDARLLVLPRSSRGVLADSSPEYDVIVFALSDPFRPVTSGAFSLTEDYDLTVESLRSAYRALTPSGLLVVPRWLGTPPSESARSWATLLAALESEGVSPVAEHVLAYRGLRSATLLASKGSFSSTELALVRQFLELNGFDPVFMHDLAASELNRHNQLPSPVYHGLFTAILRDREAALASYDFRLAPATDNRPYFFHFFRWRQTPQILATLGQQMQPFGGSGYLVLLLLFALMSALALPLVILPLVFLQRRQTMSGIGWKAILYFAALGAGYLLVEIPLITRLTLLLDRPAIALATVLFTLMLASGLGSLLSPRLRLGRALLALVLLLAATLVLLPALVRFALPLTLPLRLGAAVLLILPAGILMGIPFAGGLGRLERVAPGWIPWAWSVNGATSALSGVVAALIGLDWGLTAVLGLGTLAYVAAYFSRPQA